MVRPHPISGSELVMLHVIMRATVRQCGEVKRFRRHREVRPTSGQAEVMEVFVASYAMLMCSLQIQRRLLEALHYTEGLCVASSVLLSCQREPLYDRETFVIVNKFLLSGLDALRLAYFVARDPLGTEDVINLARKVYSGLHLVCDRHCLLFPLGANPLLQVLKLSLYSAFYIDYYFSVIQYSESDDELAKARASLQEILSSITDLAPRISRTWSLFSAVMDETRNGSLIDYVWTSFQRINSITRPVKRDYYLRWRK